MTPRTRTAMFTALRAANPHPQTELIYDTPFQLLVSVILSAQATDKSVNAATAGLFKVAPDAAALLKLGPAGLTRHIRTIGLFNAKAKHILATCAALLERHGGRVPDSREQLEALPGVGRKTANVVLNAAFGQPTMAVDTHIFRVANRTGLAHGTTPRAIEDQLVATIPAEFLQNAHHWLILLGRYICKARKPECGRCPIVRWCEYPEKNLA